MSLLPSLAIFFVIWWLCLFVVLPFGVQQPARNGRGDAGNGGRRAAPAAISLRRAAATTVLAAIIFAGVYLYFGVYGKTLEDLVP